MKLKLAHGIPTEPPYGEGWVALTGGVQCIHK